MGEIETTAEKLQQKRRKVQGRINALRSELSQREPQLAKIEAKLEEMRRPKADL
jgi:vacuolar-type H+-ATPase subunit D/Vma8